MNTQNVVLDSCVVIDIIEKPKVASQLKAKLKGKSISIILCDVVLNEVRRVRGLLSQEIVNKVSRLLGRKVKLTSSTIEDNENAESLTEQFAICHSGDNKILSMCQSRNFILVTFDKMLLKASQFVGIQVFSPFTAGGI
jgi:predicted nucleic acid-binding protein